jgi:hypothetical protein
VLLPPLDSERLGVQSALLGALLSMGRCTTVSPGSDASAYGFRSRAGAQATGRLLHDIAWGSYGREVLLAFRLAAAG